MRRPAFSRSFLSGSHRNGFTQGSYQDVCLLSSCGSVITSSGCVHQRPSGATHARSRHTIPCCCMKVSHSCTAARPKSTARWREPSARMIFNRQGLLALVLPVASINATLELGAEVNTSLVVGTYLLMRRCLSVLAMSRNDLNAALAAEYCSTLGAENDKDGWFFSQSFTLVRAIAKSNRRRSPHPCPAPVQRPRDE